MGDRFVVLSNDEAHERGLHSTEGCSPGHSWETWYEVYDTSTNPPTFVGSDYAQPEDKILARDLSWVVDALNKYAKDR